MRTRLLRKLPGPRCWAPLAVGALTAVVTGVRGAIAEDEAGASAALWTDVPVLLPNTLNGGAEDRYAAHRSHSSHRSHRSHRSSAGGATRPAPGFPSAPSPVQPRPSAPSDGQVPPRPTQQDLSNMVVRVQAALMRLGYYAGDIDGLLGPATRVALKSFQRSKGLPQTGRMDLETLSSLGIPIP